MSFCGMVFIGLDVWNKPLWNFILDDCKILRRWKANVFDWFSTDFRKQGGYIIVRERSGSSEVKN